MDLVVSYLIQGDGACRTLLASYLIRTSAFAKTVALTGKPKVVACSTFFSFDYTCTQTSQFLDGMLWGHMEEVVYQKVANGINCSSSNS